MRIKTVVLTMTLTVLTFPAITNASQDFCAEVQKWKAPQRIFSKSEEKNLLVVTKDKKSAYEASGTRVAGPGATTLSKTNNTTTSEFSLAKITVLKYRFPNIKGDNLRRSGSILNYFS